MKTKTIGAETLRICRASSCFEHLTRYCKPLFDRMVNQGAGLRDIRSVLIKFFKRHESVIVKFSKTPEQIVVELNLL